MKFTAKPNSEMCRCGHFNVHVRPHSSILRARPFTVSHTFDVLPLMDELSCRCAKCIANALDSGSDVARHGVYYGRMLSPIGRNAYFCCSRYGVSLYDIAFITQDFVRSDVRRAQSLDVILTVRCLLELLYVRHRYSFLSLFTRDELVYAICHLSAS